MNVPLLYLLCAVVLIAAQAALGYVAGYRLHLRGYRDALGDPSRPAGQEELR